MAANNEKVLAALEQRRQDLEDIGLKPSLTSRFLTTFSTLEDIHLGFTPRTTEAAEAFLYDVTANNSEALQHVRSDDLLRAMFEDLHSYKMQIAEVYEKDLQMKDQNELDEEDLALVEQLGRRVRKAETDILKVAEMRENSTNSFERLKGAAAKMRETEIEGRSSSFTNLFPG